MRIGIVGGCGKMGQWLCKTLPYQIAVYEKDSKKVTECRKKMKVKFFLKIEELLHFSDMIIVSVPLKKNKSVLEEIKKKIPSGKMVCDIASLKKDSVSVLSKYPKNVKVSSIHPMFGPGIEGFRGKKVIIIPVDKREEESKFFVSFFKNLKADVVISDACTHDKMMALSLSLPHFFGYLLSFIISDYDISKIRKFEGTSFKYLMTFSEAVLKEDQHFYFELMQNPAFAPILEIISMKTKELIECVKICDYKKFDQLYQAGKKAFEKK